MWTNAASSSEQGQSPTQWVTAPTWMRRMGLPPTWPPMRGESLSQQVPWPSNSLCHISLDCLNYPAEQIRLIYLPSEEFSSLQTMQKVRKKSEFLASENFLCLSIRSTSNQKKNWIITAFFSILSFFFAMYQSRTCSASWDMHGMIKQWVHRQGQTWSAPKL